MPAITNRDSLKIRNIYRDDKMRLLNWEVIPRAQSYWAIITLIQISLFWKQKSMKIIRQWIRNCSILVLSRFQVELRATPTKTLLGLVTQFCLGGRLCPRGERPRSWPKNNLISQKSFTLQIIHVSRTSLFVWREGWIMCIDYCLYMLLAPPTVP